MSSPASHIPSVLKETRSFPPTPEFSAAAHVKSLQEYEALYKKAADNPDAFWGEQAKSLTWDTPFETTLEWEPPFSKWFLGGKLNIAYNCVDRHVENGLGENARPNLV